MISHFEIAKIVPLEGDISYADIAAAVKVPVNKIRQVLRLAMTNRVFYEPRHGYVAHTAASRLLKEDPHMMAWIPFNTDDLAPASLKVVEAFEKFPDSGEVAETAFALAHNNENLFQFLGARPTNAKRFGMSMSAFSTGQGYAVEHLVNGYAWDQLPKDATIVDVRILALASCSCINNHLFTIFRIRLELPQASFVSNSLNPTQNSILLSKTR